MSDAESSSYFAELPAELQARIDDLCDQFEAQCRSITVDSDSIAPPSSPPDLKEFLADCSPHERVAALRELLPLDIAYRQRAGQVFDVESYAARFPELPRDWLLQFFETPTYDLTTDQHHDVDPDSDTGSMQSLVLGDCLLLDVLGRGGMGTVYRARQQTLDRIVAVKVLRASAARHRELVDRFRREVKVVASLSHPHIVRAIDAGEQHGTLYLVMEFVKGQDLATLVRSQGAYSIAKAVELIRQVAEGLAYAHEQGLIHRDIKPQNVMLEARSSGTVKILDLGLARLTSDAPTTTPGLTRTGMMMGTAEYMAPEQAINARAVDQRADVYSLGATLYFLLTARHMYAGESFVEIVMAHQMQPVPTLRQWRRDVPAELDRLFQRLVAKRPEDRPSSMVEIITALRDLQHQGLATSEPHWNRSSSHVGDTQELIRDEFSDGPSVVCDSVATHQQESVAAPTLMTLHEPTTVRRNKRLIGWGLFAIVGLIAAAALNPIGTDYFGFGKQPVVPSPTLELPIVPFANPSQVQAQWAKHLGVEVSKKNSLGMSLQLIPPGEFDMGLSARELSELQELPNSALGPSGWNAETPQHPVRLTQPYWLGTHEVTVADFRKFVVATNYQTDAELASGWGHENATWVMKPGFSWKSMGEHPVTDDMAAVNLSYNDAEHFCRWLSRTERSTYRLPTEAEWEFACRAGQGGTWATTNRNERIGDMAWFQENAAQRIHAIGTRPKANGFGLYDMLGNESEWCHDYYHSNYVTGALPENPLGPDVGQLRVQRGGSFAAHRQQLRLTARDAQPPSSPTNGSFRVVCEVDDPKP